MGLSVCILAAGKGKRMRSNLPKVLHRAAGRPLLAHVHATACELSPDRISVVYGHGGEQVRSALAEQGVQWVEQSEQKGTGHAVDLALQAGIAEADDIVLVLYGDVPLVRAATLEPLVQTARDGGIGLLTVELADPSGYGRIVRGDDGQVTGIVEHRDASPAELAITEVNTGILATPAAQLNELLSRIDCDNAQGEFYLTDIFALAAADGIAVRASVCADEREVLGVNSREQLATVERNLQSRTATALMEAGATLADPARIDVRGTLQVGQDVFIDVGCVFEGDVQLADGVQVGPYCVVRHSRIAAGAVLHSHTVLDDADIGERCSIGPFARIRPGARFAAEARVGNFVEVKNAEVAEGSKINHLAYVGDSTLGRQVNIGAGTITCNYDGARKHRTVIGDDVFVGSDCQLVAPVEIGAGATIGAGTTVTRDVEPGVLALSRPEQRVIKGWKRPVKGD